MHAATAIQRYGRQRPTARKLGTALFNALKAKGLLMVVDG